MAGKYCVDLNGGPGKKKRAEYLPPLIVFSVISVRVALIA
jgi:hypothetical protein